MRLRSQVIRLAHTNPEMRKHLLPLLREASHGPHGPDDEDGWFLIHEVVQESSKMEDAIKDMHGSLLRSGMYVPTKAMSIAYKAMLTAVSEFQYDCGLIHLYLKTSRRIGDVWSHSDIPIPSVRVAQVFEEGDRIQFKNISLVQKGFVDMAERARVLFFSLEDAIEIFNRKPSRMGAKFTHMLRAWNDFVKLLKVYAGSCYNLMMEGIR